MPVLIGLGIIAVEWALRRRIGVGTFLALAFVWAPPQLMGFLNYGLSLGLSLLAFALWVRLEGWRWRWALFLPIGALVWLAHVSGWGVLGIMVFGYEWSRSKTWRAFVATALRSSLSRCLRALTGRRFSYLCIRLRTKLMR